MSRFAALDMLGDKDNFKLIKPKQSNHAFRSKAAKNRYDKSQKHEKVRNNSNSITV